ncbi:5'/3'-nucleotidase SurE [Pontibacter sp. G13]|uniref:5'/3'-nucleotidase SurE n=1 Tax=Pontibacter sp. G13 TaxID=3074898 RepID=UPI00288B6F74|nr:5'/3'-nucleotidase SurE [Pontibacter sp. G13]WNJ21274.1 5'/3'-nucleotidase SurE [Pontibacter sp. G13]
MSNSPVILISNDDGIHAPGILALINVAVQFGQVWVVAPDSAQSGMGHAISVGKPLRIYKEELPHGLTGYAVSGTPADCVKLGTGVVMPQKPDLILSGINHGANSSVSTIYSGTLSAAREGAIMGIPAIGFSFLNFSHQADLETAEFVVKKVVEMAIKQGMPAGQCLNVNIPDIPLAELKGIKVTRQAMGRWVEEFDERTDPFGRKYYWLTGQFQLQDKGQDVDFKALEDGYASLTPMTHDLTHHYQLNEMADWNVNF